MSFAPEGTKTTFPDDEPRPRRTDARADAESLLTEIITDCDRKTRELVTELRRVQALRANAVASRLALGVETRDD